MRRVGEKPPTDLADQIRVILGWPANCPHVLPRHEQPAGRSPFNFEPASNRRQIPYACASAPVRPEFLQRLWEIGARDEVPAFGGCELAAAVLAHKSVEATPHTGKQRVVKRLQMVLVRKAVCLQPGLSFGHCKFGRDEGPDALTPLRLVILGQLAP